MHEPRDGGGEDVFTFEGMGGNVCCFFLSNHTSGKWDCAVARGARGGGSVVSVLMPHSLNLVIDSLHVNLTFLMTQTSKVALPRKQCELLPDDSTCVLT